MLRIRHFAAASLALVASAQTAMAQDATDQTISDREAAGIVRGLNADPDVAQATVDDNGDIVVEPTWVRSAEDLERWRLLDRPEFRAALRAAAAGGRAPDLSELDAQLLGMLAARDHDGINTRFGWNSRSVAQLEANFALAAQAVPGVVGGYDVDGGADGGNPAVGGGTDIDGGDATSGGGEAIPTVPGAGDKATGSAVYRWPCCDNLPMRENPNSNASVVDTLDLDEGVTLHALHAPFINQLADALAECLPENDCSNIVSQLQNFDLNVYARVKVVGEPNREGWAPLVGLFKAPRQESGQTLLFQVGFNRLIDGLAIALDDVFVGEGCAQPSLVQQLDNTNGVNDQYWAGAYGMNCSGAFPDSKADTVCDLCEGLFDEIFGEDGTYDGNVLMGHELQNAYHDHCYRFTGPGESKQAKNRAAHTCGEYPLGATHFADTWNYEETEVFETELWNRTLRVRMGRAQHQRAFSVSQYDMAAGGNANFNFGKLIDHRNFFMSVQPIYEAPVDPEDDHVPTEDHKLLVHMCGHLPGGYVDAPYIDFHWKDTAADAFNKIDFGHLEWDRLKLCATLKLSMTPDLAPQMEWVEIDDIELKGANVSNVKIVFAAWVYLAKVAVSIFGGSIGSHVSTIIAKLLAYVPAIMNILPNDEYLLGDLLPEALRTKLYEKVLEELKSATVGALDDISLDTYVRQEEMCGMALPELPETHPLHFFNAYLLAECNQLVDSGVWGPFLPHQASADQNCYGTNRFFTPGLSGNTESAAFSRIEGQDWYTGLNEDSGCRLNFGRHGSVDSRLWPVLRCMTAELNRFVNAGDGLPNSLEGYTDGLTEACGEVALQTLQTLYGDGTDLIDLISLDGQAGGFLGE